MNEPARKELHSALDRVLAAAEELPGYDEGRDSWPQTREALDDLNSILQAAEPVLRKLWEAAPEDAESASAIRWPVIRVLLTFSKLLPPEVWKTFVPDLIGLENGQSSVVFEPKRPLKRKGWQASLMLPEVMGALVIWWGQTIEKDGKPIGVTKATDHACHVLGLRERRTAEKWVAKISERTKAAIKKAAERYRAGERDLKELGLTSEFGLAWMAPILAEDEVLSLGMYTLLRYGATGSFPRLHPIPHPEAYSTNP